jgi:hypothetical protein
MRVDERIEARVREAFAAAVGEDQSRFEAALDGLSSEDGATARSYAAYVVGFIVNDVLRGGASEEDLGGIADRAIAATSSWTDLGAPAEVTALLRATSEGALKLTGVPAEKAVDMTFVLGAYLLQAYRLDGQEWWTYLDDIWAQLLAAPEPS